MATFFVVICTYNRADRIGRPQHRLRQMFGDFGFIVVVAAQLGGS